MIIIHDHETIIFYTVTFLMILGIFILMLILIYAPSNNYQLNNIKNIVTLTETLNIKIS